MRRVGCLVVVGVVLVGLVLGLFALMVFGSLEAFKAATSCPQQSTGDTLAVADGPIPGLTAEQAGNVQIIVREGLAMDIPEQGLVVAITAASQESGLRNLPYGDRDSQGLFQMRPSKGWGTVAQVTDPVYASRKFYSVLQAVPGWESLPVDVAAQRVERSGNPGAYAQWVDRAWAIVQAATSTTTVVPAAATTGAGFNLASFNVHGASHTGNVSADRRMRNAVKVLTKHAVDLVGFQEMQGRQHALFHRLTAGAWETYHSPGDTDNTIGWNPAVFEGPLPGSRFLSVPYFDGHHRQMPAVRLRDRRTGQEMTLLNVHNPADTRQYHHQAKWRRAALAVELPFLNRAAQSGPVFWTGDMNDHADFYRPVRAGSVMTGQSANTYGGIDWILSSSAAVRVQTDDSPLVNHSTDHPFIVAQIDPAAPGASYPAPSAAPVAATGSGEQRHPPPGGHPLTPAAQRAYDYILNTWGKPKGGIGGWATSGHIDQSEHYTGNALDVMVEGDTTTGNRIWDYFRGAGFKPFHVMNVIYRGQIYNSGRGLHAYGDHGSPTANHMDHVHIDFVHGAPGTGSAPDPGQVQNVSTDCAPDPATPLIPDSGGTTGAAPMPLPARVVAVYYMAFSDNPKGLLESIPPGANVVYLSFLQGDPPHLTEEITPQLAADVKTLRARGVRVIGSIGGERGPVNIHDPARFVSGVMAVSRQLPLDGIDWDIESGDWDTPDVVTISTRLKQLKGPAFAITMAPNGSGIDAYIPTATALNDRGALDMIGQQFYGAAVTIAQARGRVNQVAAAGIPASKIAVGMMMPHGSDMAGKVWDLPTCIAAVRAIQADHPGLRGVYLWETNRTGTAAWVGQMATLTSAVMPSPRSRAPGAP